MTNMRAKLVLQNIEPLSDAAGTLVGETLSFNAVGRSRYAEGGLDEDNTFARFTPSAYMTLTVLNPDLLGAYST
ncbi:MAG: hypothetical protein KGH96_23760, partial [Sphingomonadales bacterium]|nr:hypothetical protein [Sphingomonadales bacterium]